MTAMQKFSEAFRRWRKLLVEVMNPNSDTWNQHRITRRHFIALYGTGAVLMLGEVLIIGRLEDITWVGIEITSCMVAMSAPFLLVLVAYRKGYLGESRGSWGFDSAVAWSNLAAAPHPVRSIVGGVFACTLLALMAGHICLWGLRSYALPVLEGRELLRYQMASPYVTFIPEVFWALSIPPAVLRLLYGFRWQRRLDEEKLKREAAEYGQALAQAQLKLLQAQIEPHFLFNTLASVQHLVRKDPPRADFLLGQLIRYLREAMPDIRGMGSTLGREFGLVEAYLNIVRIRLDGRLEIKVNIPPELADISFPALIVQTLVENAIKHGIEPKPGPVHIDVTASETTVEGKKFIDVSVSDDGVGFGAADTMGTGVGLRNIRERLAGLYDSSACLSITEIQPSGVCASVRIPKTNSVHGAVEQSSAAESGTHGFETA